MESVSHAKTALSLSIKTKILLLSYNQISLVNTEIKVDLSSITDISNFLYSNIRKSS